MSDQLITALVAVITGLIGLAALSVIISPKANTAGVIKAGAGGLAQNIGVAISPVTGGSGFSSGSLGAWPGPSLTGYGSGMG